MSGMRCTSSGARKGGLVTMYILHTLEKGPKSGYEILSEMREKCGNKWAPSKGTVYPMLNQLEEEKAIRLKKVGKRSKNIFELTAGGKRMLSDIRIDRERLRERFAHMRNLFLDIVGEERADIMNIIFDIKEQSLSEPGRKKEIKVILEKCLADLRRV